VTADLPLHPTTDPDLEVVQRIRAGEPQLFELLMRRHNRRLFRVALSIVGNADEAEDVMQDAYMRAFSSLAQFAGQSLFSTWLVRIAIHEALARRRRRGLPVDADAEAVLDDALGPPEIAGASEVGALIEGAIQRLPDPFRVVFVLRAVEQMSVHETAECLGIDGATVKTRTFRARALLRGLLASTATEVAPHLFDFPLTRCDSLVARVLTRLPS
jgi:RNA polymerase sigma-70 factor (ECF subfamily)